mgnify:CR=1 FL=1
MVAADGARMGCGAGTRPRPAVQVVRLSFGCRITLLGLSSSRHRGGTEGEGRRQSRLKCVTSWVGREYYSAVVESHQMAAGFGLVL